MVFYCLAALKERFRVCSDKLKEKGGSPPALEI
jgi:hypothetical protein